MSYPSATYEMISFNLGVLLAKEFDFMSIYMRLEIYPGICSIIIGEYVSSISFAAILIFYKWFRSFYVGFRSCLIGYSWTSPSIFTMRTTVPLLIMSIFLTTIFALSRMFLLNIQLTPATAIHKPDFIYAPAIKLFASFHVAPPKVRTGKY